MDTSIKLCCTAVMEWDGTAPCAACPGRTQLAASMLDLLDLQRSQQEPLEGIFFCLISITTCMAVAQEMTGVLGREPHLGCVRMLHPVKPVSRASHWILTADREHLAILRAALDPLVSSFASNVSSMAGYIAARLNPGYHVVKLAHGQAPHVSSQHRASQGWRWSGKQYSKK